VLVANLTYSGTGTAITISNITGPVILDLNGFTITGTGTAVSVNNPAAGGTARNNTNPVTIRNGTVSMFNVGVYAQFIDGLTVSKMDFRLIQPGDSPSGGTGIQLTFVNDALIKDCNIIDSLYGIDDYNSSGGNRYENVNAGSIYPVFFQSNEKGATIKRCEFSPLMYSNRPLNQPLN
jgi:hypothetical protein